MKIARMLKAINHQETDRVPRGELLIHQEIINSLVPKAGLTEFERKKLALAKLNMDFVVVEPKTLYIEEAFGNNATDLWGRKLIKINDCWVTAGPAIKEIDQVYRYQFPQADSFDFTELKKWVSESNYFVFALLDGVFQGTANLLDFNQFLLSTMKNQEELQHLANAYGNLLCQIAGQALELGVHGLIIGDDMASSQGPLVSPKVMEKIFYSIYKKVLKRLNEFQKPIFLHCDGNIEFLLPHLVKMGFTGVHSLEPAAGMDLAAVKNRYGEELCLMGNIDPALLEQGDIELIKKTIQTTIKIGSPGGGFILSTASGSLTKEMNLEGVLAMYNA